MSDHSDDILLDAGPSQAPSAAIPVPEALSFMEKIQEAPLMDPTPKMRTGETLSNNPLLEKYQQQAIAAQLHGTFSEEPCNRCLTIKGPFEDCLIYPVTQQCGNCYWNKKYKECSHHSRLWTQF